MGRKLVFLLVLGLCAVVNCDDQPKALDGGDDATPAPGQPKPSDKPKLDGEDGSTTAATTKGTTSAVGSTTPAGTTSSGGTTTKPSTKAQDDGIKLDGGAEAEGTTTSANGTTKAGGTTAAPTTKDPKAGQTGKKICFDAVAKGKKSNCRGACTANVKASFMDKAEETCICPKGRFGLACSSVPKKGDGGLKMKWSEEQKGKIIKSKSKANANQLRGLYIVTDTEECKAACDDLNKGYKKAKDAPCGAITTSEADGGVLCEIYKTAPVSGCADWLQAGEGTTMWHLHEGGNTKPCGL